MQVTFLGVRGSTPSPGGSTAGYGGNTSCVCLRPSSGPPIVLDLGTGLRRIAGGPVRGVALVTHLHFDHVQGLPFCNGLLRPGAVVDVYGPPQERGSLAEAFADFVRPPLFPLTLDELPGTYRFHEVHDETFELPGGVRVTAAPAPHPGPTNGYRIEADGASLAYVPDHQEPVSDPEHVAPSILGLAEAVDLLIHDAQFTRAELAEKPDWGHCTAEYALEVARRSAAARLALFHHDPSHTDDVVDEIVRQTQLRAERVVGPEVFGAREGAQLELAAGVASMGVIEVGSLALGG